MRLVAFHDKTNLAALIIMALSLFGFLGNVMIDYNWGSNFVTSSFAVLYWMTLNRLIPFPLNYWGAGAFLYFVVFLLSFMMLNRSARFERNLLEALRLGSVILILFEIGVFYFVPNFMDKWVINAVQGTALAAFTNWDLLAVSVAVSFGTHAALTNAQFHRREAS